MKALTALVAFVLLVPVLSADSRRVEADDKTDFSAFRTFVIRDGRVTSRKTEINNSLTLEIIEDAIRTDLASKRLKETPDRPDLIVTFSITEESQRQVTGRGIRNMQATSRSVGTLVIDMTAAGSNNLIWRGTYADDESNAASLAKNLPKDAKKLLSEYPPKRKR